MCIYCGAAAPTELTTEHVIARSLNGTLTLLDASCLQCANVTKSIEEHAAREMFGEFRHVVGARTRRKKTRPNVLPIRKFSDQGEEPVNVPTAPHPGFALTFRFPPAQLLSGEESDQVDLTCCWFQARPVPHQLFQGATHVVGSLTSDPVKYTRMLAKIAHGVAVWWLGVDGFTHALKPVIDGKKNPWTMVGGELEPSPPLGHTCHRVRVQLETHGDVDFVMTMIRLFANFGCNDGGAPVYHVIAGYPNVVTRERLVSGPFYSRANVHRGDKNLV
jgi:hypothetical protein